MSTHRLALSEVELDRYRITATPAAAQRPWMVVPMLVAVGRVPR